MLDPLILPPYVVADLYGRRWRIEEAFNTVKRLLGLSYLWTGSLNGIKLQLWGTWLFYAVLVDLGDAVALEVSLPFFLELMGLDYCKVLMCQSGV